MRFQFKTLAVVIMAAGLSAIAVADVVTDSPQAVFAAKYLATDVSSAEGVAIDVLDRHAVSIDLSTNRYSVCVVVSVNEGERIRHLSGTVHKTLAGDMVVEHWSFVPTCAGHE